MARSCFALTLTARHESTLDARTQTPIYTFAYDAGSGFLKSITDANGKITSITPAATNPSRIKRITAAYGQVTTLALDANGYLETLSDQGPRTFRVAHASNGLLQAYTDPENNRFNFQYDATTHAEI